MDDVRAKWRRTIQRFPGFLTHEARLNATSTAARNVAVQVERSSGDFGHFWPLHAPCLGARGMDYQRALWFRVHRFPFSYEILSQNRSKEEHEAAPKGVNRAERNDLRSAATGRAWTREG